MKIRHEADQDVDGMVNLTPLIDIVFNLLIFFMVTTTFQQDERDLTVSLPAAKNGQALAKLPEVLHVTVRKDGGFAVGEKVVDKDELETTLARAKRQNKDQRVILRVDKEAAFRHPIVVLDMCKGLGIETSIATVEGSGG